MFRLFYAVQWLDSKVNSASVHEIVGMERELETQALAERGAYFSLAQMAWAISRVPTAVGSLRSDLRS
jgi:hypothetical protein